MRRIKVELLEPGDIVLTANSGKVSKTIRRVSKGMVSHAMLCVQHGSIVDSTDLGVQAHNIQRELYDTDADIFVYRLRQPPSPVQLSATIDFARSEIGTRYSKVEAARSVLGGPKPRTRQLFCSRLVARAYAHAGIHLVHDADYCTPDDIRASPLLELVEGMVETVADDELVRWAQRPNPVAATQDAQNEILDVARRLDPNIENFNDLDAAVQAHPEWDAEIARAYRESGYFDLWRTDFEVNFWHYNLDAMDAAGTDDRRDDVRAYCVSTIREAFTGGLRYAINLTHYQRELANNGRETTRQLVALYERLVWNDQQRRDTALAWLERHFPDDAQQLERIEPHSEHWFSIIDRVEPRLGYIARLSIKHAGKPDACSACGDPPSDYRLVNGAEAMPGVPSLRLCNDCVKIRRDGGEILVPM